MTAAVVYYSKTGRTKVMAELVAQGMRAAGDVDVHLFDVGHIDNAVLSECKAVVFGTPTYYANMCWQLKKWFDESWSCKLGGRLGAAFATADYAQGGADIAIQAVLGHLMVKGMLVYSGGSSLGQPYIHLGPVALKEQGDSCNNQFVTFGRRIAEKALELFG